MARRRSPLVVLITTLTILTGPLAAQSPHLPHDQIASCMMASSGQQSAAQMRSILSDSLSTRPNPKLCARHVTTGLSMIQQAINICDLPEAGLHSARVDTACAHFADFLTEKRRIGALGRVRL